MDLRPINFQGIVDLDPKIVEQLERYLQEKESRLAHRMLNLFSPTPTESSSPLLPTGTSMKFSEAVEGISKKVRQFVKGDGNGQKLRAIEKQAEKEINLALWEFTEVLEGCVVELFQQIKQIPINRWHLKLSRVIQSIKELLIHRIEDLIWVIRRLEKPLKEFSRKCHSSALWKEWVSTGKSILDPELLENLQQTEKYLKTQFEKFNQRYNEYIHLSEHVEFSLEEMKSFPILALLDMSDQNLYVDVYRLLKTLELNPNPKKDVGAETTRALKNLTSVDRVISLFNLYFEELQGALFHSSIEWKSLNQETEDIEDGVKRLQLKVEDYQHELYHFMHTISRYRSFILKNDPNPYVSSRWGFTEWIVGPEPAKAKAVLNLIYLAEELKAHFAQFSDAITKDVSHQQEVEYQAHQEIERLLHEMGQPLISKSMMRSRAEHLLEQLRICDEIGSPQMSTIDYFEEILSKAMREDWKYHVLHEFPLFHQIYHLHEGLQELYSDPAHAFRIERFNYYFGQIEEWVNKEDVYAHVHEIELDMNDMKTYLQDFLASIQRTDREKGEDPFINETLQKYRQQLLEYRYLFGQFFKILMEKSSDCQQLRHQFLFVDQYFETMENLVNELGKELKKS